MTRKVGKGERDEDMFKPPGDGLETSLEVDEDQDGKLAEVVMLVEKISEDEKAKLLGGQEDTES